MIYIWIRRTLDWGDEEAITAQIDPEFRPRFELWNSTFNISYPQFRQRIRAIAALNHAAVESAVSASWDEIPDGAVVLPVDDDDWFAPHAARTVERAFAPGIDACTWPSRWLQVPTSLGHRWHLFTRRLRPSLPQTHTFGTNSYALVKEPALRWLLDSHSGASRYADEHLAAGSMRLEHCEAGLSLANRTLASKTTLAYRHRDYSQELLIRKYRAYRRLYRRRTRREVAWSRPELDWSMPYVELMADLVSELELTGR
jgi:hypothetical protein